MANVQSNVTPSNPPSPFGVPTALNNFTSGIASNIAINPKTGNVTTPAAFAAGNQPSVSTSYNANVSTANALMGPLGTSTPPTPTQSVASQVHTDAAGNSVKTTYAPSSTGILNTPSPATTVADTSPVANTPSTSNPTSNPNFYYNAGVTQNAPAGTPLPTATVPTYPGTTTTQAGSSTTSQYNPAETPQQVSANLTPSGLLQNQIGESQTNANTANTNAQTIIQSNQDTLNKAQQELEAITSGGGGGTAGDYEGRVATLQGIIQQAQNNINNATSNTVALQGQAQSALAGGVASATNLVQSPYGTPMVNPLTGTEYSGGQNISSGGASGSAPAGGVQPNDPAYASLQAYAQQVASGNMQASAVPTFGSNPVTLAQLQSMAKAINPNYNPASTYQTEQGIISQNITQGQQYQQASQQVSNAVQLLPQVTNLIAPFMAANNLNSQGLPIANQQINTINQQTDPVAYSTMTAAQGEIKSFTSAILQTSGMTPTDADALASTYTADLGNMTPAQLSQFVQNMGTLGQYRLSQLQSASGAGYSANANSGSVGAAQGVTANLTGALGNTGQSWFNGLPDGAKLIVGAVINGGEGVGSAIGSGSSSAVAGAAAGAGEATAASVLGI